MRSVYHLLLIDTETSYEHHEEAFSIGIFSSRKMAEETAEQYLAEVKGFKEHDTAYRIEERRVTNAADNVLITELFLICGWNENDALDETDVIYSDCFMQKSEAEQACGAMKAAHNRTQWCIDRYLIDECDWKEGYIRLP